MEKEERGGRQGGGQGEGGDGDREETGAGSVSWSWWREGHCLLGEVPMVGFPPSCRANT